MRNGSPDLLSGLLKDVSRSFYLTLRALPRSVRSQIGLAYLLARASDTIADTDAVPQSDRLQVLELFRGRICGQRDQPLNLDRLAGGQSSAAERMLLERIEEALAALLEFDWADQERIRAVLTIIIGGQSLDLTRFGGASPERIASLVTEQDLDDYTYRVAGCVGVFWTQMCRAHLFPAASVDDSFLLANGVRFGKGLQLVNILRDLPADLRLGRCYLPERELRGVGLAPADLLNPASEARLRPLYLRYLDMAEEHLEAGWAYTNHLPRGNLRVRLACAWPILIGMQTLTKLRTGQVLEGSRRIKISRKEVRQVLVRSVFWYPWPGRWHGLLNAYRQQPKHVASASNFS